MDLHGLAKEGDSKAISKLLDCGDLAKARTMASMKDSLSRTPLHLAAFFGHTDSVSVLLEYSEVDSVASDGFTALHFAAQRGHVEVVRRLMMTANVNRKTFKSLTPLHLACQKSSPGSGHEAVICELLNKRADASVTTRKGETALELVSDPDLRGRVTMFLAEVTQRGKRSRPSIPVDPDYPSKHRPAEFNS